MVEASLPENQSTFTHLKQAEIVCLLDLTCPQNVKFELFIDDDARDIRAILGMKSVFYVIKKIEPTSSYEPFQRIHRLPTEDSFEFPFKLEVGTTAMYFFLLLGINNKRIST